MGTRLMSGVQTNYQISSNVLRTGGRSEDGSQNVLPSRPVEHGPEVLVLYMGNFVQQNADVHRCR